MDDRAECRVLQVFSTLGVGGAEVWLMALLRHFARNRDALPVRLAVDVCLTGGAGVFDAEASSLGARLFYLPYTRKRLHLFIPGFRRLLSNGRYHAIHDHQDYVAGVHFLFGLGHLPPVRIAQVHNTALNLSFFYSSRCRRYALLAGKHLLGLLATHILGTSRQVISDYGFESRFFRTVSRGAAYCGFDVSRFQGEYQRHHRDVCSEFGWEETAKVVLFVGRLDSNLNQKNPTFALDVGQNCASADPNIRMLVAGGGDGARRLLEARVASWGLEKRIRFLGVRSDVPRLMMGSDLLLFTSLAEGLGMVVVEAQAAGLRVLASDTTPRECVVVPDLVQFVSLNAGADRWADAALRLVQMPRPDNLECNGAVRGSSFSIENSAATLLKIYQAGVGGGERHTRT
jgi:glycosyltransferase involved in cell wall biosynthesis